MDALKESLGRRRRDGLVVIGALGVAALLAGVASVVASTLRLPERAAKLAAKAPKQQGTKTATATAEVSGPDAGSAEVAESFVFDRPVPPEVLRTSTVVASPRAPGLRLLSVEREASVGDAGAWEDARAVLRDETSGSTRSYAIGDLLPHGSLLVGIGDLSVDALVGDAHLVRLFVDGHLEEIEDLEASAPARALPLAKHAEPVDADEIRLALLDLRSADPTEVQAAIDRLIEAGDPALELLMNHVDSEAAVADAEYAFPSGSQLEMRPKVLGAVIMLILERITGQTFGDVTREALGDDERREIAKAWRRWFPG